MKVISDSSAIDGRMRGAVVSVGNFDGVHLGHQRILARARELAAAGGSAVLVLTFEPHPLTVLRPDQAPARLTPWPEKARLLEAAGVDGVLRMEPDRALLSLTAEAFVRQVLVDRLAPTMVVEGPGFRFGRDRRGDVALLRAMSRESGFGVEVVDGYRRTLPDGSEVTVSSSAVRGFVSAGQVESAAACLGRPYRLIGRVVRGAGAGERIGFPTINLEVNAQLVPSEGVYAGLATVSNERSPAAISVGRRPTMGGRALSVEAHVLDRRGDWYGSEARIDFIARIRDQARFAGPEALAEQIGRDVISVRAALAAFDPSASPDVQDHRP